jgi:hypothetical protein
MTNIDREKLRAELAEIMSPLIKSFSEELDKETLATLYRFVENYEFGVALDWLCLAIREQSITVGPDQKSAIQKLAKQFNTDISLD